MLVYKLFKIRKDGSLHPLYVHSEESCPIGEWISAKCGEKKPNGKVKSKLGDLAYRPGLHCTSIPLANHIGKRQPDGTLWQAKDTVWGEVEVIDNDLTAFVKEQCKGKSPREQYLKTVPVGGYYWYTTNPQAEVSWLIAGEIKIIRILSNKEVNEICLKAGHKPQPVEK